MNRRFLVLIVLALLLSLSPGPVRTAQADEGACLAWDVTGVWHYRASAGGYGTLTFQQNLTNGWITGSWHNEASGGSGDFDSGGVVGHAIGFHPTPTSTWRGTISSDGRTIQGIYELPSASGTWEMEGQARCTSRQPLPPSGSARVTVRWGEYVYRLSLDPTSQASALAPEDTRVIQRIVGPFGVTLRIEAIYYGDDLPNRLEVVNRWNDRFERLGWLERVGTTSDGGVIYRGTVRIPQRVIGPGEWIVNEVKVVDPGNREELVTYVDQFIVDPSGYIYDASTLERIEGAMVSCYQKQGSTWVLWNAEQWRQTNPLVSNDVGHYGWDVPPGDYKVVVTHQCYADAESPIVTVPPPRTDVHIGMTKTGCSALDLAEVITTDEGALPQTEFQAGDSIQYHVTISNTGSSDVTVDLNWTVTGPDGLLVEPLSGSGGYVVASFGAQVSIEKTLPADLAEGTYKLRVHLKHQGQTSEQVIQFWVSARSPGRALLPVVLRGHGTPVEPPGIHGRVTYNGAAAAGVGLELRFYNGSSLSTVATTSTGGNGRYRFAGNPSLGPGQIYYVRFGPNSSDTRYLFNWLAPDITSYTAGSRVAGGDFDIADVELLSPAPGSTVGLPTTFNWRRRSLAGDTYRWSLIDISTDDAWWTDPLGDVGSFQMTALPPGRAYDRQYGWTVWVCNGPDNCGLAYYYRTVTFRSSLAGNKMSGVDLLRPRADRQERVGADGQSERLLPNRAR